MEIVVAAIVELSKQLEDCRNNLSKTRSRRLKSRPCLMNLPAEHSERKFSRALASAADKGNEKDVALTIYQFLEAL